MLHIFVKAEHTAHFWTRLTSLPIAPVFVCVLVPWCVLGACFCCLLPSLPHSLPPSLPPCLPPSLPRARQQVLRTLFPAIKGASRISKGRLNARLGRPHESGLSGEGLQRWQLVLGSCLWRPGWRSSCRSAHRARRTLPASACVVMLVDFNRMFNVCPGRVNSTRLSAY